MLATLFDRCMKRRGVKESDPYDWEKTEAQLQQQQQLSQSGTVVTTSGQQQQQVVAQPISGAANLNNLMNNMNIQNNNNLAATTSAAAATAIHSNNNNNLANINGNTANNNNINNTINNNNNNNNVNLVQTTTTTNLVQVSGAATGGTCAQQTQQSLPPSLLPPLTSSTGGQAVSMPISTLPQQLQPQQQQQQTMANAKARDGAQVLLGAVKGSGALTPAAGATGDNNNGDELNMPVVPTSMGLAAAMAGICLTTNAAERMTAAAASDKHPPEMTGAMAKLMESDGMVGENMTSTTNNMSFRGQRPLFSGNNDGNNNGGGKAGTGATTMAGTDSGKLQHHHHQHHHHQHHESATTEPIESLRKSGSKSGAAAGLALTRLQTPSTSGVASGGSGAGDTGDSGTAGTSNTPAKLDASLRSPAARKQYENKSALQLLRSSNQSLDPKKRALKEGSSGNGPSNVGGLTGRLRVLTAPPISCQDLAQEAANKMMDPLGHIPPSATGTYTKRQLRTAANSNTGSRVSSTGPATGGAGDEKRNSSSIGGNTSERNSQSQNRLSNNTSSRDSKVLNFGSGSSVGRGDGHDSGAGDHSVTQFALIDDDNVSQQMTRGGGGGHTLASQWKSQFDDSEETTDNEWRIQEPQSPDICLSRDTNRSSQHYSLSMAAVNSSKRRSKSGVAKKDESRCGADGTDAAAPPMLLQRSLSSHQLQCCVHATDANNNNNHQQNSGKDGGALVLVNDYCGGGGGSGSGLILNQLPDHKKEKLKKRLEKTKSKRTRGGENRLEKGFARTFANIPLRSGSQQQHLNIHGIEHYDNLGMLPPCWSEPALNAAHLRKGLEPPFLQQAAFDNHVYHIDIRRNVCICKLEGERLDDPEGDGKYKSCPNLLNFFPAALIKRNFPIEASASMTIGPRSERKEKSDADDEDEKVVEDGGEPISGKLEIRVIKTPDGGERKENLNLCLQIAPVSPAVATVGVEGASSAAASDGCSSSSNHNKKEAARASRIPIALSSSAPMINECAAATTTTSGTLQEVQLPDTPPLEKLTPALRRRRRQNNDDKYVTNAEAELNLRFNRRSRNVEEAPAMR